MAATVLTSRSRRSPAPPAPRSLPCARSAATAAPRTEVSNLTNKGKEAAWSSRQDRAAIAACSLSQPKSDVSDFGRSKVPNSGKPEFGWERGGVMGYKLSRGMYPLTPTLSPAGRGSPAVPRWEAVLTTPLRDRTNGARPDMFGWRRRIGYIGPTVMEVVPYEFYRFAPDGVGLVGVTCNIDDWSQDYFDQALAQVTTAAAYLGSRGVDFILHGGGPLVVARGKGYEEVIVRDIEAAAKVPAST